MRKFYGSMQVLMGTITMAAWLFACLFLTTAETNNAMAALGISLVSGIFYAVAKERVE